MSDDDNFECARCGRNVLDVHPQGWILVEARTVVSNSETMPPTLLCAGCMPGLAEYLCPELLNMPMWTSGKDQLFALLNDPNKEE